MKKIDFSDYTVAAGVLFAAAVLAMLVAALFGRGDITTATLVLGSVSCFIAGVFLLAFSRPEPIDTRLASLLAVQGTIAVSRLCTDLGVRGRGYMVPENGGIVQVIPVSEFCPMKAKDGSSFAVGPDGSGIILTPLGYPLLEMLEQSSALRLPDGVEEVLAAIREVFVDVFEVAEHVEAHRAGDSIAVALHGYRLFPGCERVRKESPAVCTRCPCPVCSLIACMLAKGTGKTTAIDHVAADRETQTIRLTLIML